MIPFKIHGTEFYINKIDIQLSLNKLYINKTHIQANLNNPKNANLWQHQLHIYKLCGIVPASNKYYKNFEGWFAQDSAGYSFGTIERTKLFA